MPMSTRAWHPTASRGEKLDTDVEFDAAGCSGVAVHDDGVGRPLGCLKRHPAGGVGAGVVVVAGDADEIIDAVAGVDRQDGVERAAECGDGGLAAGGGG